MNKKNTVPKVSTFLVAILLNLLLASYPASHVGAVFTGGANIGPAATTPSPSPLEKEDGELSLSQTLWLVGGGAALLIAIGAIILVIKRNKK